MEFDDFCSHYIDKDDAAIVADVRASMRALISRSPDGDSFGALMVRKADEAMAKRSEIYRNNSNARWHKATTKKIEENADSEKTEKNAVSQEKQKRTRKQEKTQRQEKNKMPYGDCGNVMLAIEEGKKLRESYGDDLQLAISILDGYIESLPSKENGDNRNGSKYWKEEYLAKDHYSVLRVGNWVWNRVQETKTAEARRKNSESASIRPRFKSQAERNADEIAKLAEHYSDDETPNVDNILRIAR